MQLYNHASIFYYAQKYALASARAVRHPRRDALAAALRERGVGTLIHYPIPLHLQPALAALGGKPGDHPVAEKATAEILSLPLHPELSDEQARVVVEAVRAAARGV